VTFLWHGKKIESNNNNNTNRSQLVSCKSTFELIVSWIQVLHFTQIPTQMAFRCPYALVAIKQSQITSVLILKSIYTWEWNVPWPKVKHPVLGVCVCVRACVRACVCVCSRACVSAVYACQHYYAGSVHPSVHHSASVQRGRRGEASAATPPLLHPASV